MWLSTHPIIPSFKIASDIFCSSLRTRLSLPHPTTCGLFRCICNHAINLIGIHIFCCVNGGEHTTTHDVIQDFFASIAKDVGLHVNAQTNTCSFDTIFPIIMVTSGYCVTVDGICTLVNIVITNLTHANFVLRTTFS